MTTKPKAKKYRIRRGESLSEEGALPKAAEDEAAADQPDVAAASIEQEIATIRKEELTGRQLRMARRLAQKHGLAPTSDFDAIRQLRAQNIDPFQRANLLELVVAKGNKGKQGLVPVNPAGQPGLPSTEVNTAAAHELEITRIQRDITRRRRLKLALLITRLATFILLPTILVGYYYFSIATPMYATNSKFIIQKADAPSAGSGLSSALAGTGLASSLDSTTVQGYLQSREAMLRLDADIGFKSHFSQAWIDPIQRLDPDATNEAAYRLYKKQIIISYDPSEGPVNMEVIAADPATSQAFSEALIHYAEDQVDQMTSRLRDDQMAGAREGFERAEAKMLDAQRRVLELQEESSVLNIDIEIGLLTTQISQLQSFQTQDELALAELRSNPRPNRAKLDPLERRIATRGEKIASLRAQLTEGSDSGESIARTNAKLVVAQTEQKTRTIMMQQALQALETARMEANRQTRYLSTSVNPIAPDEATYPRKLEYTMLAFLIFSGIYLMISLTTSILHEQVTS